MRQEGEAVLQCQRCHTPLPGATRDAECPHCLLDASGDLLQLAAGFGSADTGEDFEPVFAAGACLGPYEIDAFIAAGGMGEIYRARDTRLNRTVAIKAMRPRLARTDLWREQFDSEARVIAKLNHPHICSVYDVGHADGTPFVVMEFVDGETLASRLGKGPLKVEQALDYAIQIGQALDEAHRHGIVHRDVKPANLVITARGVKLLDFGLARVDSASVAEAAGTPIYMAPEQSSGTPVDHKADIFAFGVIMHEMLAGGLPFAPDEQREAAAPLPADCPAEVAQTIRRCLAERPDERIECAGEVVAVLERAHRQLGGAVLPQASTWRIAVAGAMAALVVAALLFVVVILPWKAPPEERLRFTLDPPAPGGQKDPRGIAAISPDGRRVAWLVSHGGGRTSLAVGTPDGRQPEFLPDTDGARVPSWTPDGERILFFADGYLRSISTKTTTKAAIDLAPAAYGQGASEGPSGEILFAPDRWSPLYLIPAPGQAPVRVRELDRASGEVAQHGPVFLPGSSQRYVYLSLRADGRHAIYMGDVGSGVTSRLVESDSAGTIAPPDMLLFVRQGSLHAVQLALGSFATAGPVRTIEESVHTSPKGGFAMFSASATGKLVFHELSVPKSELVWFDRGGRPLRTLTEPARYRNPALADNGAIAAQRYVIERAERVTDRAELVIVSGTSRTPVGVSGAHRASAPVWSPGGGRLAFATNERGVHSLFTTTLHGAPTRLLGGAGVAVPASWSPDGRVLLYELTLDDRPVELRLASLETGESTRYVGALPNARQGRISPDGRWLAYTSDVTGRAEIYVDAFPTGSGRPRRVSRNGGHQPFWRSDGRELFYITPGRQIVAVPVRAGAPELPSGAPVVLFEVPRGEPIGDRTYAVSSDGRVLLNLETNEGTRPPTMQAVVVTDWRRRLEERP